MANGSVDGTATAEIFAAKTVAGNVANHSHESARKTLRAGYSRKGESAEMFGSNAIQYKGVITTKPRRAFRKSVTTIRPQILR